jgi:hypothetical protein
MTINIFSKQVFVDGSSRFGKTIDLVFSCFSAGWIISEEGFLKDNETISFKIKRKLG